MKGIYIITNKINQKKYIGLSNNIKRRFSEHKSSLKNANKNNVLYKAFKKYGLENFNFKILELVENIDELASREVFWIKKIKPEYNMNKGGLGNLGHVVSEDVRNKLKISATNQWNNKSKKDKNKIISNNLKGRSKGYRHSLETKIKLRNVNLGKKLTNQTKDKISKANKKSLIGNKNGNKKIIGYKENFKIEFDSLISASKYLECHPSNISKVLKGTQKTCKGFIFKYGV